ncbi:MAG: membrane-bound lytic murein transglycosylase MltF [Methyloprofundus sp.]|nr:membrane-bound lytic murein transglycosylase MltF [Methyloprofundus sp.]
MPKHLLRLLSKQENKIKYVVLSVLMLSGCSEPNPVLSDIQRQGKLVVLTINAPTTYYSGANDKVAGFEADLSKAFADSLGVEVEYKVFSNITELLSALNNNEGHLVASGLTRTAEREKDYLFGTDYKAVQQEVVCHRKSTLPKTTGDLLQRSILINSKSSYQETLLNLQKQLPELKWLTNDELAAEQVLLQVVNKEIDCTLLDSNILSLNRRYFPNLVAAFPISKQQHLAWVLPSHSEGFKQTVTDWFAKKETLEQLAMIDERYYGYADFFDFYNNHIYLKRIKARLPQYTASFKKVAEEYQLPWTLLAAQSYQESGWHSAAVSHTGVRGLMMLTRSTAKLMGVKDRVDPYQSIHGGAKYLQLMLQKVQEDVLAEDKIWFALAAYNIGFAHMLDARKLARELGKSPSTWHDMRTILPLLSQKKYYKNLKYGYARGIEPVKYIDQIRYFQDVLVNTLEKSLAEQ